MGGLWYGFGSSVTATEAGEQENKGTFGSSNSSSSAATGKRNEKADIHIKLKASRWM